MTIIKLLCFFSSANLPLRLCACPTCCKQGRKWGWPHGPPSARSCTSPPLQPEQSWKWRESFVAWRRKKLFSFNYWRKNTSSTIKKREEKFVANSIFLHLENSWASCTEINNKPGRGEHPPAPVLDWPFSVLLEFHILACSVLKHSDGTWRTSFEVKLSPD